MPKKYPRLAFWLTVIPAALGSALGVYHLFEIARTIGGGDYAGMLGGFSGSLYLVFDYFVMSLPISLMLLSALLLNLLWSHSLKKAWNITAMASIAVFLICGLLILLGINSGILAVSLNLAARAIAEAVTAVALVHSLTVKSRQ
ncbi:MAG: hypothetical protein J6S71_05620 [Clostridia bacterium]|nr:hypothetical protein [Clostridia bacterium]